VLEEEPALIDTGFANQCNKITAFRGQTSIAISDQSQGDNQSIVYIVPIAGECRAASLRKSVVLARVVAGRQDAGVVGQRNDDFDIYTIPSWAETRRA